MRRREGKRKRGNEQWERARERVREMDATERERGSESRGRKEGRSTVKQ